MKVIDDNFLVCTDCIMVIANGDYSELNYYYPDNDDADPDKRAEEIDAGIENAGGRIVPGNPEYDKEFSSRPCDCCGSHLAGHRHHCVIIGY